MTIVENSDYVIKTREEWLKGAKRAAELVKLLPAELQALEGKADVNYYGETEHFTATFSTYNNKDVDLLRLAKMIGVQGLNPTMRRPESWWADGAIVLPNGMEVTISLTALPAPPSCRIEEYQETVTKYRAICPQTGEELK